MKDKWMNIGYEDDELKPYQEPSRDCIDPVRIGLYQELLLGRTECMRYGLLQLVILGVCQSVMCLHYANAAEWIRVLLGMETLGDKRNIVLDRSTDLPMDLNGSRCFLE